MDLPSLWSQGLRGQRHTTAAEPECFCGEHLLFQQKCIRRGKSIPAVPRGSYSHHKRYRPHTSMESCCKEGAVTRPDTRSFAFPLAFYLPLKSSLHHLLRPAAIEPARPCFPHLCPTRELQTAVSVSLKEENLQGLVDSQHKRMQDSGKSVFPGQPVNQKRSSPGRAQALPDSVSPTHIWHGTQWGAHPGHVPGTWPHSWSMSWFLGS